MKKGKWLLSLALVSFLLFIYVFIPHEINSIVEVNIPQNQSSISRKVVQKDQWKKWMPYPAKLVDHFNMDDGELVLTDSYISSVNGLYILNQDTIAIHFETENIGNDSSLFKVAFGIDNRYLSPLKRLRHFMMSKKLASQMKIISNAAQIFYGETKNVYGFDISLSTVKDSILITTNKNFADTPTTSQIYQLVALLKIQIDQNKGVIQGDPMINISKLGVKDVFVQIALPLANTIQVDPNFMIKKMVLGHILTAKVTGDNKIVYNAFNEVQNYVHDHHKEMPAIPFITFNTNRLIEKDSSKWVSTIYYPIY